MTYCKVPWEKHLTTSWKNFVSLPIQTYHLVLTTPNYWKNWRTSYCGRIWSKISSMQHSLKLPNQRVYERKKRNTSIALCTYMISFADELEIYKNTQENSPTLPVFIIALKSKWVQLSDVANLTKSPKNSNFKFS